MLQTANPRASGPGARRWLILGVALTATLAINLDTTVVNIALPTLALRLRANTGDLQWVVDGYNLAFAAFVLTGGTLGDRFGQRRILALGLGIFAGSSLASAFCASVGELVALRLAAGLGAALIFPTTLSVITTTFEQRSERAWAIGAWGAIAGLGVAIGPLLSGFLLEHFAWGAIFIALVPLAVCALGGALWLLGPPVRTAQSPLDPPGLATSVVGLGALVYSVIEAPSRGWTALSTLVGFAVFLLCAGAFLRSENRAELPMLDPRLFRSPRFSAASVSITLAFFALFGFIFLMTQYFQELRHQSPLLTGIRTLPIAGSLAVGSVLGTQVSMRRGNKAAVVIGFVCLAAAFAWAAQLSATVPYATIAGQMVLLGLGIGLTTVPATEAVMGAVQTGRAGAGSAVNDATREVGGTLGVAVLGSVFSSRYRGSFGPSVADHLPGAQIETARSSVEAGVSVAHHLNSPVLLRAVSDSFMSGLHVASDVAGGISLIGLFVAMMFLPGRPRPTSTPSPAPA